MSNNYERGDFEWKGDEVVWVPSKKGRTIIHPVLGPMDANSPLADVIIGIDLAKEIDESMKEKVRKLNLNITQVKDFEK